MVEITMLTDSLARIGLTPADVAALGAACTAAALAGLATKEVLRRINTTHDERIAAAEAKTAQAEAVLEATTAMVNMTFAGISGIVKEALIVGSVLPDTVG